MKTTLAIAVLAVLLGSAVGVGSSIYQYNRGPTYGFSKPLRKAFRVTTRCRLVNRAG